MRILKWLFQPAYLLFIIVLIALYVNREVILPDEVAESLEVEALTEKVNGLAERLGQEATADKSPAGEVEVHVTADIPAVSSEKAPAESIEDTTAEAEEVAVAAAPAPVDVPQASHVQPSASPEPEAAEEMKPVAIEVAEVSEVPEETVAQDLQEEAGVTEKVAATEIFTTALVQAEEAKSPAQPETPAMPAAEAQVVEPPVEAKKTTEEASQTSVEATARPLDVWRDARRAVWQGDLGAAVVHYRQLISLQPHNYDAYGEMGNVLLAQSDVAGAVEAYVAAARLIYRAGHVRMANRLGAIITRLDEERGRALWAEFSQR